MACLCCYCPCISIQVGDWETSLGLLSAMRFDFAVYLGKKADKNKNPNQTRESKKRKTDEGAVVAYTTAVRACAAAGRPAEAEALVLEMIQVGKTGESGEKWR